LNVPDEHQGAYMLAGVLDEALLINGVDTSRVHQVNILRKEDKGVKGRILPEYGSGGVYVFPGTRLVKTDDGRSLILHAGKTWYRTGTDQVWYWDRVSFRRLE
jgi:hypothetical protein